MNCVPVRLDDVLPSTVTSDGVEYLNVISITRKRKKGGVSTLRNQIQSLARENAILSLNY